MGVESIDPNWVMVGVTLIGTVLVIRQLKGMERDRNHDNVMAAFSQMTDHNWRIAECRERQEAVENFEHLSVPEELAKTYWAERLIHLSHLNLIWIAWELDILRCQQGDGFRRFAWHVVRYLRTKHDSHNPESEKDHAWARSQAAQELWKLVHSFDVHSPRFCNWLMALSDEVGPLKESEKSVRLFWANRWRVDVVALALMLLSEFRSLKNRLIDHLVPQRSKRLLARARRNIELAERFVPDSELSALKQVRIDLRRIEERLTKGMS